MRRRIKRGQHRARLCRAGKGLGRHRNWQSCLRTEISGGGGGGGGRASAVVCAPRASRGLAGGGSPYVSTLVLASRDEGHLGTCGCAGTKGAPGVEKPFHVRQALEARERKAGRGHSKD